MLKIKSFLINYRLDGEVYILIFNKTVENPFDSELDLLKVRNFLSGICKGDIKIDLLQKRNAEIYFGLERYFINLFKKKI